MIANVPQDYAAERRVAIEAVREAAQLCRLARAELVAGDALEKGDRSPVTVADFGAQALIGRRLVAAFPADPLVAEEDAADLQCQPDSLRRTTAYVRRFAPEATPETVCAWIDTGRGQVGGRFWTLDPIDGTKGFLRNDQYATALALVEQGQVQVAALACPALPLRLDASNGPKGCLFVAVRGRGAAIAPLDGGPFMPIHVAAAPAHLRLVESVEARHGDSARQEAVARVVGVNQPPLRMDSQAKYAAVARGDAALYLRLPSPATPDYREKIWDHAAGSLLVEEAGGRVTDMEGCLLKFGAGRALSHNRGVVVSNGGLHPAILEALRSIP